MSCLAKTCPVPQRLGQVLPAPSPPSYANSHRPERYIVEPPRAGSGSATPMFPEGRRIPSRRVTFVADELLGYVRDGIGTTTTFLSVALARMGHRVEVLYLAPRPVGRIDPEWGRLYDGVGINIRTVPRGDEA